MSTNPSPGLNPGVVEPHFSAWRNFVQAYGLVFALQRRELEEECGMQMPWYEVLLHLNEAGDAGMEIGVLQTYTTYSQSGLSQLVGRMVADGVVSRRRDDADRRRVILTITERGIDQLRKAAPVHRKGIERHFASLLDERQAQVIAEALEAVVAAGRSRV